jgi:hypothetical protein
VSEANPYGVASFYARHRVKVNALFFLIFPALVLLFVYFKFLKCNLHFSIFLEEWRHCPCIDGRFSHDPIRGRRNRGCYEPIFRINSSRGTTASRKPFRLGQCTLYERYCGVESLSNSFHDSSSATQCNTSRIHDIMTMLMSLL